MKKKLSLLILIFVLAFSGSWVNLIHLREAAAIPYLTLNEVVIFQDNFEDGFKTEWSRGTNNPDQQTTWGITNYRSHTGSHSLWCAKKHRHLIGLTSHYYYNNMKAWVQLENLDFTVFTQIKLEFYYWSEVEENYDFFKVNIRDPNGQWHEIKKYSKSTNDKWIKQTLDLSEFKGQKGITLQFLFESDFSNTAEGVYIDDAKLIGRGYKGNDQYEPDNSPSEARLISLSEITEEEHYLDSEDEDWFKFYAIKDGQYVIRTIDLQGDCDTTISLYNKSLNLIKSDDDSGDEVKASRINWTCNESGLYYLKIYQSSKTPILGKLKYTLQIINCRKEFTTDKAGIVAFADTHFAPEETLLKKF